MEYRIAAADANPYMILAAALGSGLWGIEHKDRARADGGRQRLRHEVSRRARAAAHAVGRGAAPQGSKMAREWFGDEFVEHFAATREWEEREFRKHITDWELARYFEII